MSGFILFAHNRAAANVCFERAPTKPNAKVWPIADIPPRELSMIRERLLKTAKGATAAVASK
jgi:hypothetical protein